MQSEFEQYASQYDVASLIENEDLKARITLAGTWLDEEKWKHIKWIPGSGVIGQGEANVAIDTDHWKVWDNAMNPRLTWPDIYEGYNEPLTVQLIVPYPDVLWWVWPGGFIWGQTPNTNFIIPKNAAQPYIGITKNWIQQIFEDGINGKLIMPVIGGIDYFFKKGFVAFAKSSKLQPAIQRYKKLVQNNPPIQIQIDQSQSKHNIYLQQLIKMSGPPTGPPADPEDIRTIRQSERRRQMEEEEEKDIRRARPREQQNAPRYDYNMDPENTEAKRPSAWKLGTKANYIKVVDPYSGKIILVPEDKENDWQPNPSATPYDPTFNISDRDQVYNYRNMPSRAKEAYTNLIAEFDKTKRVGRENANRQVLKSYITEKANPANWDIRKQQELEEAAYQRYGEDYNKMGYDQQSKLINRESVRQDLQAGLAVQKADMKDFVDIEAIEKEVDDQPGTRDKKMMMKIGTDNMTLNYPNDSYKIVTSQQTFKGELKNVVKIIATVPTDTLTNFWIARIMVKTEKGKITGLKPYKFNVRRKAYGKYTRAVIGIFGFYPQLVEWENFLGNEPNPDEDWTLWCIYLSKDVDTSKMVKADNVTLDIDNTNIIGLTKEAHIYQAKDKEWIHYKNAVAKLVSSWKFSRELAIRRKMNKLKYDNINTLKAVKHMIN